MCEGNSAEIVIISALEHYAYCPRQCALIHVEATFEENLYTLRGQALHENVDRISTHLLEGIRYERALPIWSHTLRVTGKADLVEFHDHTPYPVEYKVGKKRKWTPERIQLCAQALCLEEMFKTAVPKGAVYYHASRKRMVVEFTDSLRREVLRIIPLVRELISEQRIPPPVDDQRCRLCSLEASCLPHVIRRKAHNRHLRAVLYTVTEEEWDR